MKGSVIENYTLKITDDVVTSMSILARYQPVYWGS